MNTTLTTDEQPNGPEATARVRSPRWMLGIGALVFAATTMFLSLDMLPPMLDTDVTIPAGGPGSGGEGGHIPPSGPQLDHGPGEGP